MAHFNYSHKRVHVIRLHIEDKAKSSYSESSYIFNDQTPADVLPNDIFQIVQNELANNTHHIAVTIFSGNAVAEKAAHTALLDSFNALLFHYNSVAQKVFYTKENTIAVISNF